VQPDDASTALVGQSVAMSSTSSVRAAAPAPASGFADALAAADAAALRAGVTVLELRTPAETGRAAEVLREIWRGAQPPVPANLLRTVQHTGGYVYGAYDSSGRLVGATLGLLAADQALHSHLTGVLPSGQRRGLGIALKLHQRAWALQHGLRTVTWTCDPLVRRNVAFNLHALGAQVVHYLPDHYGAMDDGVNKGDESDRFEFDWDLTGTHALAAVAGRRSAPDSAGLPSAVSSVQGRPVSTTVGDGPRLVALPDDIEALRLREPATGRAWRQAVREALVPALAEGLVVRGVSSEGALVLTAGPEKDA
jgi:predicted GNAT superfamily acetyltransferase